ncbi:MAG: zf-HC2 domain-containing protein [Polyangiaceae bacterium]|nr:zf-HC2 domain-containing protein [Polyangiaceae bacterium]
MSALKAPTDCVLYARAIHAYVDGELSVDHTTELEAHVAKCSECFDQVEQYRAIRLSLRRTSAVKAPSDLRARMAKVIEAESKRAPSAAAPTIPVPLARAEQTGRFVPMRHVTALAVAAGVVALVGASRLKNDSNVENGGARPSASSESLLSLSFDDVIDDLVAMHASPLPPETTNPDELAKFDPFVGVPVRRPAEPTFQPLGVRYDGARMHRTRTSRAAAALFYSMQNGHRATIYVFDPQAMQLKRTKLEPRVVKHRPVYVGSVRGYSFAATERSGVGYALATDLDAEMSANLVAGVQ